MKIPWVITYSSFYKLIYKLFLEHPNSTDNPQGYWTHGIFSATNSVKLIGFGLLGVIHGILPCVFKFSASSYVIRSFILLVKSNRHKKEVKIYMSQDILEQLLYYNKNTEIYDEDDQLNTSTWD